MRLLLRHAANRGRRRRGSPIPPKEILQACRCGGTHVAVEPVGRGAKALQYRVIGRRTGHAIMIPYRAGGTATLAARQLNSEQVRCPIL